MAVTFDTLRFAQRLRDAKVDPTQAEAMAHAFAEATGEQLATQVGLDALGVELRHEISDLRLEMRAEFAAARAEMREMEARLRTEIRAAVAEAQRDLLKWLVPLLLGQAGLVTLLVKLL
jgi:hypothetical protein